MKRENPIKFGTDGWRAVIAREFTFDNVRVCAQGLADYMNRNRIQGKGLVVGYDNRFASEDFAAAVSEVAAANDIKVYLSPRAIPTPEVSFGTVLKQAGAAVVITASHNPAGYNGLKIKSSDGASAPTELIDEVEQNISRVFESGEIKSMPLDMALEQGKAEYSDFDPFYLEKVSGFVDLDRLKNSGLKIAVDSMYGAGAGYFKRLLEGGTSQVIEINSERNPLFPGINPEPIAVNLKKLADTLKKEGAAIGLATDGDSDRIGIIDEKGRFITQLEVYALLALYLLETRRQTGAIVKTVTATSMLYSLGEMFNVPVIETPVGFKYVAPVMMEKNALIGGEESGGYGFQNHIPERDAILAGLYFLDFMVSTGKTPSELLEYLFSKVGPHYYHRRDFHFPGEKRQSIMDRLNRSQPDRISDSRVVRFDTLDGFRYTLEDNSWLLVRFSGTEPLIRVYSESSSQAAVEKILDAGQKLVGLD
ncbi:MAG: phosphoglucomutase/phosphomannomutase family protein [Dehalococcoidales bacterium]|nr:phosphoglucomutase/phosphomannomutase family protein [Dehalococcoidales bacterium]